MNNNRTSKEKELEVKNKALEIKNKELEKQNKALEIQNKKLENQNKALEIQNKELENQIIELKIIKEELRISQLCYKAALSFSEIALFQYDIKTKQMFLSEADVELYKVPEILEDAVESFIRAGIISKSSEDDFRRLYEKIEEGAPSAEAIIHTIDMNKNEIIIELKLINIFDNEDKPICAVGIRKDITETVLLKREKEYGNRLVADKLLFYEANVSKDQVIYYNKKWAQEVELSNIYALSNMIKTLSETIVDPKYKALFLEKLSKENIISQFEKGEKIICFEYRKKTKDGKYQWFEKTVSIIKDQLTGDINIRGYSINIEEKKQKALKVFGEKQYYEAILAKSVIVYEMNITKNLVITGHEDWSTLFDIKPTNKYTEMINAFNEKALHKEDREGFYKLFSRTNLLENYFRGVRELYYEYRRVDKLDTFSWFRCTMHLFKEIQSGDIKGFAHVENIHEEKQKELELIYKAQHDLLTDFYNKITVEEKMNDYLSTSEGKVGTHVFFIIDLDYFKRINDTFGHAFGDVVLVRIADKINGLFREQDILGRIGGDEFVVLMKNVPDERCAILKAKEICENIEETYSRENKKYRISVSIGVVFYRKHGKKYEDLYKNSDIALYYAKRHGKNQFFIYNVEMDNAIINEKDINEAIHIKKIEENIIEYVFRMLYEALNKTDAIYSVLEFIGKNYDISRVYICEDSQDGSYTRNTFEWCNEGISSRIKNLQKIPYDVLKNYKQSFNEEGIFYISDSSKIVIDIKEAVSLDDVKNILHISILKDGKFIGFIGFEKSSLTRMYSQRELSDIRSIANILGVFIMEMRAVETSEKIAYVDRLTGVATLQKFKKDILEILKGAMPSEYMLMTLDVEDFKYLNDSFGYEIGDEILKVITKNFLKQIKQKELIGRIEADKFIFLRKKMTLDQIKDEIYIEKDIKRWFQGVLPDHYLIHFSMGIYTIVDLKEEFSVMLDKTNFARKSIKGNYNQDIAEYTAEMNKEKEWKKEVTFSMEKALINKEFEVFLQPKYLLSDETLAGAEALIRWNHPEKGMLSPFNFIPIFEKNGFIKKLDLYVLEGVCKLLRKWKDNGLNKEAIIISVNLSRLHLYNPFLIEELLAIVNKYDIQPQDIEIELTESIIFNNTEKLIETIKRLKKEGFYISIDDFGSGYSSLNMLKDLPVDILKIDKEFLGESSDVSNGRVIINAVNQMAKNLKLVTVAEGVETQEQVNMLKVMGCDLAQGYYYAKPMPIKEFEKLF